MSNKSDSITLDTGAVVEGNLSRYVQGGNCEVTVTQAELTGVVLTVPCYRVQSFVRTQTLPTARPVTPADGNYVAQASAPPGWAATARSR